MSRYVDRILLLPWRMPIWRMLALAFVLAPSEAHPTTSPSVEHMLAPELWPLPSATAAAPPRDSAAGDTLQDGQIGFLGRARLPPKPHLPFMLQDFGTRQARAYFLARIDAQAHAQTAKQAGCNETKMQLALLASEGLPERENAAHFVQTYQGVPIEGTYAFAVMGENEMRYARHFFVPCPGIDTQPKLTAEAAQAYALAYAQRSAERAALACDQDDSARPVRDAELVIIYVAPLQSGEAARSGEAQPKLAWRIDVDTQKPWETRTVFVAAATGEVLATRKRSHDATGGRVSFDVEPQCLGDAEVSVPMPHLALGAGGVTDADGNFSFETPRERLVVALDSPFVHLINHQGKKAGPWTYALAAEADNDIVISDTAYDQIDPLYHIHQVRAWVRRNVLAPNTQTAWTDGLLDVHVNIDDACNAYYDGSLHFFAAGDGCLNTGRVANLIYHEYTHGVHAHSTPDAAHITADAQVGEGVADYVAATLTGNPNMRGIYACDDNFRSCVNRVSFCEAPECDAHARSEPHLAGQALAGALWELRQALVGRYRGIEGIGVTDRFVLRFMTIVGNMHSAYQAAIAADEDDDGDPSNGTKHSCEINKAFLDAPEGQMAPFPGQTQRVPCHPLDT